MSDISKNNIVHMAKLAMLNLTDNEIDSYTKDMQDILGYVEMMNQLDTSNVNETIGMNEQKNVFRKDEVEVFGNRDILLQNALTQEEGMFQIPKVIN